MSNGTEREEKEHVIKEEASWEETLERLEGEQSGSAPHVEGNGKNGDSLRDSPDDTDGCSVGMDTLQGLEEDEQRESQNGIETRKGSEDKTPAEKERNRITREEGGKTAPMQKRSKRSRKELIDLLSEQEEALREVRDELENVKQELAIKDDKLLRMIAEFENYKKRTRREWELHQKRATAELIKDILGILDDFERAFEASDDAGAHFRSGIQLIYSGLLEVLGRAGLTEVEAEKLEFDPQYHEALGEVESEEVAEGRIVQVVQKGYKLHDQLLRPAKVIVAKLKGS